MKPNIQFISFFLTYYLLVFNLKKCYYHQFSYNKNITIYGNITIIYNLMYENIIYNI
jgi:hypothetical protein